MIFKRNLTSILREGQCLKVIEASQKPLRVLELGCGDGNISRNLAYKHPHHQFFASDISEEAIECARQLDYEKIVCFRISDGINSWKGQTFDLIISDIASISEQFVKLADWYEGVPAECGTDGMCQIERILPEVAGLMHSSANFVIPAISLSNTTKQFELLNERFETVDTVAAKKWPLSKDLQNKIISGEIALRTENWSIEEKFGQMVAETKVLLCKGFK